MGAVTDRSPAAGAAHPGYVDVAALLAYHRAVFGDARMDGEGGQGNGAGSGGDNGGTGATGGDSGGRVFSQADVNAMLARERTTAQQTAAQQIATDLGVPVDEAKQIIADRKATDDARKSEAERDREAAATAKAEADRYKAQAMQDLHDSRVEVALARAGVDLDNDVLRRAAVAAVDVPVGADADAVKAAVEKAKTDAPQLFGQPATGSGGGGTHSDAGGQRRTEEQSGGEFGSRGAQEAARRWSKQTA